MLDEAFPPATLTAPPMIDEEFVTLCAVHAQLFFEVTAEGDLIVMSPTHSKTGVRRPRIASRLDTWSERDARGFATDSSTGLIVPNGARSRPSPRF